MNGCVYNIDGDYSYEEKVYTTIVYNADGSMEPNAPELNDGMIPVNIANDGTVTKANVKMGWYNYRNKEWANMVLVSKASRDNYQKASPDTLITQSDILGYFVWIPRYSYQLINAAGVAGTNPVEIQIRFENRDTSKSTGTTDGEWLTHPGFTFCDKELNGIWVAKFETTGDATTPTSLPNVSSLRSQNISAEFATSQLLNNTTKYGINNDSHMAKNSEWGAVAYLSHSKYGINDEIRINNNSNFTTGCGASTANASSNSVCQISYGSNVKAYPQSTTGNITGIFDMSGGTWEYTFGNYSNTLGSSGFTKLPDKKYYETYTSNQNILGDAMLKTQGLYDDNKDYVSSSSSWSLRGGDYGFGTPAGSLCFYSRTGVAGVDNSFRLVLSPNA